MQDEGSMGLFDQKQGEPVAEGSWGGEEGWKAGASPQCLVLERDLGVVYE